MLTHEVRKHNAFVMSDKHGKKKYDANGKLTGTRLHNPLPIENGRLVLNAKTNTNARKMSRRAKFEQFNAWTFVLDQMRSNRCDFNWVTQRHTAVFSETAVEEIIKRFSV